MLPVDHEGPCQAVKLCGNRVVKKYVRRPATRAEIQAAKGIKDCRDHADDRSVAVLRAKAKKCLKKKSCLVEFQWGVHNGNMPPTSAKAKKPRKKRRKRAS